MQGPATVTVKWSKLPDHKETLAHSITFHPVTQDSIDATWLEVCRSIIDTAKTVLSMKKSGRPFTDKQTWLWTDKVQKKVKVKKTAFKNWIAQQTEEA